MERCWVPSTPAKPGLAESQSIYKEKDELQELQANWSQPRPDGCGTEGNSIRFTQEIGDQYVATTCGESSNGNSDNLEATVVEKTRFYEEALNLYNEFSMCNVPFKELLALADAAGTAKAVEEASKIASTLNAEYRTSAPKFTQLQTMESQCLEGGFYSFSDTPHRGSAIPSRLSFDLNSPPRTMADACEGISSKFVPITPDHVKSTDKGSVPNMPTLCMAMAAKATDMQKEVTLTAEFRELQNNQSELVENQSCATTSTVIGENFKPEMGNDQQTDLSKTPVQKPRRRKHRPKVVVEGQPKKTRNPRTPKPTVPEKVVTPKRKYVRRNTASKPLDTTLEGRTNGIDAEAKPPGFEDMPKIKRKYTKRKGVDQSTPPSVDGNTTRPFSEAVRVTRSSCKKSLNFDLESQETDERSTLPPLDVDAKSQPQVFFPQDQSRSTKKLGRGMDVMILEKVGIAYDLTQTMNHALEDYLLVKESQAPSSSISFTCDQLNDKKMACCQNDCTRKKCPIVFSDVTHDKGASIFGTMISDAKCTTRISSTSNCSSSACLTQEPQAIGSKRQRFSTADESESCSINAAGAHYNSLQAYQEIFPPNGYTREGTPSMLFPTIFKKKRTETLHKSATSSILPTSCTTDYSGQYSTYPFSDPQKKVFISETDFGRSIIHYETSSNPDISTAAGDTQHEHSNLKCLPTLGSAERLTKKRSKGHTRVRDIASLLEICRQFPTTSSKEMETSGTLQGPYTCMDALIADTHARLMTKKRSKRNSVAPKSPNAYNHHQFATMSMGPPSMVWKNTFSIDAIIEQFNCLDIRRENNFSNQERTALVAYHADYSWQNSIVVYQKNGTIVPFDGSFYHTRKRRSRPKVDLDDETSRVWKLLLEDINNEGIDGTDERSTQWWEEEREVFRGRADSFIARMRLVQGDRRFSPWKGSVVDSVVGVFLTQNVSDHLSSSAFMSMAARFPLKSTSHHLDTQSCELKTTEGPEVLDPDDTIEWHKKVSNQTDLTNSRTLCDKYNEELINTRDFSGNTTEDTKASKNLRSMSSDSSECSPKLYNEPDVSRFNCQDNERLASCNGDQREIDDVISSQNSVISPHCSTDSIGQTASKVESNSQSSSETEPTDGSCGSTSFVKLLQMAGTTMLHGVYNQGSRKRSSNIEMPTKAEGMACILRSDISEYQELRDFDPSEDSRFCDISKENELSVTDHSGLSTESSAGASCQNAMAVSFEELQKFSSENFNYPNNHQRPIEDQDIELVSEVQQQENNRRIGQVSNIPSSSHCILDVAGRTRITRNEKAVESNLADCTNLVETVDEMNPSTSKAKRGRNGKEKINAVDWDKLRKQVDSDGKQRERTPDTMDSVDWEAVRCADVEEIAQTIKERGMNNMLAERIKDFLNRLVREHENIELEWLRDVPPDKAKEFLLSIRGLGLKSVECVRLLTLHHLAFPVDTNVGRIAVRLGWVPLQPLPESLQLHLLELYPVLESIQKFLWPRLCKLDQPTLYELHYQLITFGKVFCTKSKPNCNACPMRGECRHFASAFASARLALPAPEEKSIVSTTENKAANRNPVENINQLQLPLPQPSQQLEARYQVRTFGPIIEEPATPEPIIEVPATPEPEQTQVPEMDIEDAFHDDADDIPTINLNIEELNQNLQNYIQNNALVQESEMSKALVVLTPEAASIPMPKLKNRSRLRTEHQVYELPDTHPLLAGFDRREPDDPSSYLLAIWTPGETVNSIQPPERRCGFQESGKLCNQETCFSCNSIREAHSQTVRGTILIPCRTAMRGSFPLNGTYFQVNEVFADHASSLNPIDVPRDWLWNLRRRTVYFGTSVPSIFKGLSQGEIQFCFWRGFVCVRGFERQTRAPRPLVARLHFPASKLTRTRGRTDES
ncbi:hypothetical protein ACH5RR_005566 [Cinchona calisaya]|uniref:HhH-GPD domain-containing protein n=1 Tax=Cinchona calisaya TaxID=153742 RepID=A0ABD3ALI9_9GENT